MAEITKSDIKEALGFIGDAKKILDIFNKAEYAIAVLGQLDASVSSLGKKAEGLRAEVAGLEGQKAKFAQEREAQKKTLEADRLSTINSIEAENAANKEKASVIAQERKARCDAALETTNQERLALVREIHGLSMSRDGIEGDIKALIASQTTEQSRLDAILGKIAELKSRL